MDNTFIQEKLIPRLTFNPGLALTGFRTTRPGLVHTKLAARLDTIAQLILSWKVLKALKFSVQMTKKQ